MTPIEVSAERRLAAPHPGPIIKREYVDALEIDTASLAAALAMDRERLEGMLAGTISIDVDAAIRFARALQLPAERIMQMQIRADFAAARPHSNYTNVGIVRHRLRLRAVGRRTSRSRAARACRHALRLRVLRRSSRRWGRSDAERNSELGLVGADRSDQAVQHVIGKTPLRSRSPRTVIRSSRSAPRSSTRLSTRALP